VKSECGNSLMWFFGVVASHKQCQSFNVDEVADQNDRTKLMTTKVMVTGISR
jgi:hypothetical protein